MLIIKITKFIIYFLHLLIWNILLNRLRGQIDLYKGQILV